MDTEKLKERVQTLVPDALLEENRQFLTLVVPAGKMHELALNLRDSEDTLFDYLFCLTGVDDGKELWTVYHLESTVHKHCLVLKVKTADRENPVFDTVTDVWKSAEFYEREIFDLFGIRYSNHPDLRRIFLEDTWKGFPFRKDYIDEVNIVEL
jgi:NADH-quinone oxidoreductase subunit C